MAISVWRKAKTLAHRPEAVETLSRYGLTPTVYQFNDGGDAELARAVRLFDGFLFVNRDGVVIGNLVPTDNRQSKVEPEVIFEDEPKKHRPNLRLVQSTKNRE